MELWIEKMQEKFNKDLGELKTNRDEQDNNQNEKCTKGIYSRTTETEEWTSNLEDRMMEISTVEQNKEKRLKRNENSIRELWDNIKCTNIRTIGVPKEEEKYKWPSRYLKRSQSKTSLTRERRWSRKSRKYRQSHTKQIQGGTCWNIY